MVRAVNAKDAVDLYRGCALRQDFAFDAIGMEDDLRIFCALENFLVHLLVTHAIAGMAAGGIEHHFTTHIARRRVVIQPAPLELKSSVNGMERISEGKRDRGFGRNKIKHYPGSLSAHYSPQNQGY